MFIFTIGDVIGFIFVCMIIILASRIAINRSWRQSRCKHDAGVNETSACQAICIKCGKDLGFIGAWRDKNKHEGDI